MSKEPKEKKHPIGVGFSQEEHDDIESRAKAIGISKGKYVRIVMQNWLVSGEKLTISE